MQKQILVSINLDRISLSFNFSSMFIKIINNIARKSLLHMGIFIKINRFTFIKIINVFKFIKMNKKTFVSHYSLFLRDFKSQYR